MAKIGLPKGSGKRLKVREKPLKSQGILKWILSDNPVSLTHCPLGIFSAFLSSVEYDVRPDLGPNCLQKLSADGTKR